MQSQIAFGCKNVGVTPFSHVNKQIPRERTMEIDFHHGTTYVLSRMAGFTQDQAYIIAYSSQYVDDAGTYLASGALKALDWHAIFFDTYEIYEYIDSSHDVYDLQNVKELDQHKVWIPFHFLPGGIGNTFLNRVRCTMARDIEGEWQSVVARDIVNEVVNNAGALPCGLQRLGITMHVLADTFAHQGFGGIKCKDVNNVSGIEITSPAGFNVPRGTYQKAPPIGHARAEHLPDYPFLCWSYTDAQGNRIIRNNPEDFSIAAALMLDTLQQYRNRYYPDQVAPLQADVDTDMQTVRELFTELTDTDAAVRNRAWITRIGQNAFRCCTGNERAVYLKEGAQGSWWANVKNLCPLSSNWRYKAVGYRQFNALFMDSEYKRFQDALKGHLSYLRTVVFPSHGICAL